MRIAKESFYHAEDFALKTMSRYFGEEFMGYLKIERKAVACMPTELVRLEAKQMYEDFNYLMDDGGWYHFEFESDSITKDDLKRFREYEAVTSRTYGVAVTTFVVCSANVKEAMEEFIEGINTYRVRVIRLKDDNADRVFEEVRRRKTVKLPIGKEMLIQVLLTPLMSGETSLTDRFMQGFLLLREAEQFADKEELRKMQAVFYAFAGKFLKGEELEKVKEVIAMTALGEMLFNDGIRKGIEEGIEKGIEKGIERGIEKGIEAFVQDYLEEGKSESQIIEKLEKRFGLTHAEAAAYFQKYQ